MSQGRIEMNAVILPDGRVLAVGGSVNDEDTSTASLNADLLAPDPKQLRQICFFFSGYEFLRPAVPLGGTATSGCDGVACGRQSQAWQLRATDGDLSATVLVRLNWGTGGTPIYDGAPSAVSYGNEFSVQTPDAATIDRVVLVRNGTVTHAFGMDQREVELSFTVQSGILAVTAPPNGNIARLATTCCFC